jgi:hypothetical protein
MRKPAGLLYDEIDAEMIESQHWYLDYRGYARSYRGKIHRLIMRPPEGFDVDHINGNKLDNRRTNLRVVTHQENCQNRPLPNKNNTSGHRGVSWHKRRQGWCATVRAGEKKFYGQFKTLDEAVEAARAWRLANMPGALS